MSAWSSSSARISLSWILSWVLLGSSIPAVAGAESRPGDHEVVDAWLSEHLDGWLERYEFLHAHPELSLHETETAAQAAQHMRAAGYTVQTGIGGTGVVGVLANGTGPTVLIRGDMDALPITEETGLPYASRVTATTETNETVGVMHACGHDLHTTNLLGTGTLLASLREQWRGTLVLVAQPAEELGRGALAMMDDGLFEKVPRPDFTLALHVEPELPAGTIGYTPGWAGANVDAVDITVYGRGGHGARPHQGVDPIVTSAYLITELQTLVSRRVDPLDPAVVTVGSIHGGRKHNVIPNEVHLQLTVRSYSDPVRAILIEGIRQLARDTCLSFQCPREPEVSVRENFTPAVYNDPALTRRAVALFQARFGADRVVERRPSMGGDDFGRYARTLAVPGLLLRLGSVDPERVRASQEEGGPALPSLHSSKYAPAARPTLETGMRATSLLALELLSRE